ncbi:ABC transporter permease [Elusimicrobiota bacterium]
MIKMLFALAYKNITGAKLRTWLNVASLSFIYVLIVWHQSLFIGMQEEGTTNVIEGEAGAGQYWQEDYDPFDPIALDESNAEIKGYLDDLIKSSKAFPQLIVPGTIYPQGRMTNIILRGVTPDQDILKLDFTALNNKTGDIPVILGTRMAGKLGLKEGDYLTVRFRDAMGTFDAIDARLLKVVKMKVPGMDRNQLWFHIKDLHELTGLYNKATIITVAPDVEISKVEGWIFRGHDFLLSDLNDMIITKKVGGAIMYLIFLFLAMLAVFDTQILSIFRRKKEIGTLISLGMTRKQVVGLFTLEGSMHGILAAIAGAIYGTPLLMLFARHGLKMPEGAMDEYGYAIADTIYPIYSVFLVLGTILIIMTTVIIVSYLPSRKISKMNPTEALKGKIS